MQKKNTHTIYNSSPSGRLGGALYLHIPFCKQACYYCDFHFSTSLKKKEEMIAALIREIELRKNELSVASIETIYFGGGTPSVLSVDEIKLLIASIYKNFTVVENPEITLEANPDDLSEAKIVELSKTPVNRLSIGIQSFFEEDLQLMNRAHNAEEAKQCLSVATQYFDAITIDLIYGIPHMTNKRWKENIQTALNFEVQHISSYALTVEPKTALEKLIEKGKIEHPKDEVAQQHFKILVDELTQAGFIHYELSNFGKPDFFSKHNTSYWQGKKYVGIGPSAHSFNGKQRSWNVANNTKYIKSIQQGVLPSEIETLTEKDRYNEYIMTGLRTIWGVSLAKIKQNFGEEYVLYVKKIAEKYIVEELLYLDNGILKTTARGIFLSDGIASDLFILN